MKKLNKTEINALARKIRNSKNSSHKPLLHKGYKKLAKLINKLLKTSDFKVLKRFNLITENLLIKYLPKFLEIEGITLEVTSTWQTTNKVLGYRIELISEEALISISEIKDHIILSQLDSDNLDDLILKVNELIKN